MLNDGDIEFMRDSLDEIYTQRTNLIDVIYLEKQYDPINGMAIGEKDVTREVDAVVTELSAMVAERAVEGGIKYDEADVKFDVEIDLISDIADAIEGREHDGKEGEVAAGDKKGIGERNRYEILGREIA